MKLKDVFSQVKSLWAPPYATPQRGMYFRTHRVLGLDAFQVIDIKKDSDVVILEYYNRRPRLINTNWEDYLRIVNKKFPRDLPKARLYYEGIKPINHDMIKLAQNPIRPLYDF